MIHLRSLEPEDLDLLYTIENDPELWETSNNDTPYSRYALKQYIAAAQSIHECGDLRLVIEIKSNEEDCYKAIGFIDLLNYSPLNARAEIGIALLKAYRGKGYGSSALQQIEKYAVSILRIHSLHAWVTTDNVASFSLFEKAGYKLAAKLPDWHFSMGKYKETALFLKIF